MNSIEICNRMWQWLAKFSWNNYQILQAENNYWKEKYVFNWQKICLVSFDMHCRHFLGIYGSLMSSLSHFNDHVQLLHLAGGAWEFVYLCENTKFWIYQMMCINGIRLLIQIINFFIYLFSACSPYNYRIHIDGSFFCNTFWLWALVCCRIDLDPWKSKPCRSQHEAWWPADSSATIQLYTGRLAISFPAIECCDLWRYFG